MCENDESVNGSLMFIFVYIILQQKQKAVLQKNLSPTLSSNVIRKRSTNAVKATNNTVKSLVELSKVSLCTFANV